MLKFCI